MYLVNEYKLITAEKYLELLDRIRNLNKKIFDICKPRYQFNLRIYNNELKSFSGKELFFYEAISAKNFCFRPIFYIKREIYDLLKQMVKNNIKIGFSKISLTKLKQEPLVIYNNQSIYGKIDIKVKIEHCKLVAQFDNKVVEIPPIGISNNGIPFNENKIPDELQTSGWWIEGTAIKYYINTFENNAPKNFTLKLWYYKKEK